MEIAAIIGLGNPGAGYATTRHNLGFMVVDELAARWKVGRFKHRAKCHIARRKGARPLLLAKPQTFMNQSGEAVVALCRRERLEPPQCLVVVDDIDLPLGELRLRPRGGPGSHNGMRSIVDEIGEEFPRLRLGIRGDAPWQDLAEHVLEPFGEEERALAATLVERAATCVEAAVHSGLQRAAASFNGPLDNQE